MVWLFPSVVATFTGTIALAVVYSYLAVSEKQSCVKKWAIGWWLYALRYVFMMLMLKTASHPLLIIANQSATLISGVFLLWGTYEFIGRKMPGYWFIVSLAIQLWIVGACYAKLPFLLFTIPTFTFLGAIYIWTGCTFLRSTPIRGFGASLTGYSFILWGIHKMNYPFLRPVTWFAPWGYLLASVFEMFVALGILLIYFQNNKSILKSALDDLQIQEKLLSQSQKIAHLGSWHFDIKKNILTWSAEQYRIFGRTPQEFRVTYEAFLDMIHPDDRSMVDTTYTNCINNNLPYECIHRIIRSNGEVRTVLEKSEDIIDEKGETVHSFGFTHDITERKQVEDQLVQAKHEWEETFDTMHDAITIHDKEFNIIRCNQAVEKILGVSQQNLLNQKCYLFYHGTNCPREKCPGRKAFESGKPSVVDFFEPHLNKYVEVRALPRFDENKQVIGIIHIVRDITERNQAVQEKANLEKRLNQAQKMEAIGTLAGGIAHDFNNILGVVIGYTGMLKDDVPPGSRHQKDLEKVLSAANRAKDLVKQILAFSRQTQVDRLPIKIQPLIKEGLKMLRSSIPTTISITEDIDPTSGTVLADPTQIHQILMNLCTNAYHAMETTGGELAVTLKTTFIDADDQTMLLHLSTGEYVELTVTDTGSGIGPDVIEKIFDPYFTTKEVGKGTGMGLAIIHGILKEYGGAITVDSQLGKGSTFRAYIPVIEKEALPEMEESEDIPTGIERILFIDDEELLAEMGKDMLDRLGYKVTVRRSSLEALTTFQNSPEEFDLIITDQTMPEMTGSDLACRIMQIRPGIPIILCTGYSNLIDEASAKALGIKEFTLKPLTKGVIFRLIRKVMDASC
nr:PAS domain S-box protein [Desulfobulbaceae bacterium]